MAGWTRQKRLRVEAAFYQYLDKCVINSKDHPEPIVLGEHIYDAQRHTFTAIFDALEADIHDIYILKARQLGISTGIRALVNFLLGVHRGLKGAVVFDTDEHKADARSELVNMIHDFPASLRFPGIESDNRTGLTLANSSKLLFMSAGVKKSKSSGVLGRSAGLTIAHCSELCSWDNEDGLEAFRQSLSEVHENRLYIYESTARGYNMWNTMWEDARKDPDHCCCIFLGWWLKNTQVIERTDKDFSKYGEYPPTETELKKMQAVAQQYDYHIRPEQIAWIRRKMDPAAQSIGDEDINYDANPTRIQEQPWTESEAFQQTGAVFFSAAKLTEQSDNNVEKPRDTYMFSIADEFDSMFAIRAQNLKSIELKVWEEPEREAVYVFGVDPAFGENENNCRSSIQGFRCYANGIDQVCEYAWPLVSTQQLAWVLSALMGWYSMDNSESRYILELNGPGASVFTELRSLKQKMDMGYRAKDLEDKPGLRRIFSNVRTFIYSRPDSMGHGYNYHMKTTASTKVSIMEDLRNFISNGLMRVRSAELIKEMNSVAREGDSIKGAKFDDRVVAAALASYFWKMQIRPNMIAQRRTREFEEAKRQKSMSSMVALFHENQLSHFFAGKRMERINQQRMQARNAWRYGRRS